MKKKYSKTSKKQKNNEYLSNYPPKLFEPEINNEAIRPFSKIYLKI